MDLSKFTKDQLAELNKEVLKALTLKDKKKITIGLKRNVDEEQLKQPQSKILLQKKTFLPLEIISKLRLKYSEGTIPTMDSTMRRISREVFGKNIYEKSDYVLCWKQVLNFFESLPERSRKAPCNTVRQILNMYDGIEKEESYKKYYEYYGLLIEKEKLVGYVQPTKTTDLTWLDVENKLKELENAVQCFPSTGLDKLAKKKQALYRNYVMLSLYVYLPPLRPEDWLKSSVVKLNKGVDVVDYAESNGNIIDMTSGKLVIAKYKTEKTHDTRVIDLPLKLLEIIRKYTELTSKMYLFMTSTGKIVSSSGFNHYWDSIEFGNGRTVSPDFLRQLYISEKVHDGGMSYDNRKRVAYTMGHSLQTQEHIYTQYSKNLWG